MEPHTTYFFANPWRSKESKGTLLIDTLVLAWMGEFQSNKRKRIYSFQTNTVMSANFYHTYMAYLLPALAEASRIQSCHETQEKELARIVRFEVDMGLVASTATAGFAWSHALRRRLQYSRAESSCLSLWVSPPIARTLVVPANFEANGSRPRIEILKKRRTRREMIAGEDLGSQVQTLRTILPGGDGMVFNELLSEVGSYVICLELQVSILRSLLDDPTTNK